MTFAGRRISWWVLGFVSAMGALYFFWWIKSPPVSQPAEIVLLIPDQTRSDDAMVQLWQRAAGEEGVLLRVMTATSFMRPLRGRPPLAVILPDGLHRHASDALVGALYRYVDRGGQLMLTFDAGILENRGNYSQPHSRFSQLAGINYGFYGSLGERMVTRQPVLGRVRDLKTLGIPPGKFMPMHAASSQSRWASLRGYQQGELRYTSFVTQGSYPGHLLMKSSSGSLIAGYRTLGQGGVLFVNLPLTYLMQQTDGLLLHTFLRYFAENLVGMPQLLSTPGGVGGLVMNWHLDSNAVVNPLAQLQHLGIFKQGPYSIHITAGPDTNRPGDSLGLDVPHNPAIQSWIKLFVARGDAVGSHGGWIHNYFGQHVPPSETSEFRNYLQMNKNALEAVSGRPVLEYSAPEGNHPLWVSLWLEKHGVLAYYTTGNSGLGMTRGDTGLAGDQQIWAFPLLGYDSIASFEEASQQGLSEAEISAWLVEASDFCASQQQVRMIYFHPPGALLYPKSLVAWLDRTAALKKKGRFQWYTMQEMAVFMRERSKVSWSVIREGSRYRLIAEHPDSLEGQSWRFPAALYTKPVVESGRAQVKQAGAGWTVTALGGRRLFLSSTRGVIHAAEPNDSD